jgi:hypothetical protein
MRNFEKELEFSSTKYVVYACKHLNFVNINAKLQYNLRNHAF